MTKKDLFEKLYIKERRKSQTMTTIAAVAFILFLGALMYNFQSPNSNLARNNLEAFRDGDRSLFSPNGEFTNRGRPGRDITSFLQDDGSVNTEQIDEMLANIPNEFRDMLMGRIMEQIDAAEKNNEINNDQAKALKKAFEIE